MVRIAAGAAALMAVLSLGLSAHAGVYTDDMSKCLVKSSSDDDKARLMRWLFVEMSMNPIVKSLSSATPEQRQQYEKEGAVLMQRLVLTDCRQQTLDALKYEGGNVFEASSSVLGQVAGRGLMADPSVSVGLQSMAGYLDKDRWAALVKEAGLPGNK